MTDQINLSCYGVGIGSAAATVSGGKPPYTYLWSPSGGTNATATGLAAGNYSITITDASSNVKTTTLTITQPTALTTTMSSTPESVSGNGTATATPSGGTIPYTYAWSTSPVQTTIAATGLSTGTYTVIVTDAFGCTFTNTVFVSSTVGVVSSDFQNSIKIYPNPNFGVFEISLNSPAATDYVIEINNILGQNVYSETLKEFAGKYTKSFNVASYGKGIYLVNIRSNENQVTRKIVVY
jgi:hypothetical protein